jgi:hypothetical protein
MQEREKKVPGAFSSPSSYARLHGSAQEKKLLDPWPVPEPNCS